MPGAVSSRLRDPGPTGQWNHVPRSQIKERTLESPIKAVGTPFRAKTLDDPAEAASPMPKLADVDVESLGNPVTEKAGTDTIGAC